MENSEEMGKGNVSMKLREQPKAVDFISTQKGPEGIFVFNKYQQLSRSTSSINVFLSYPDCYEMSQPDTEYKN